MKKAVDKQPRFQIHCPGLPLAVYREIAAHLRQVAGVDVGIIPQTSQPFDYYQSQVRGLWIQYGDACTPVHRERVNQILAYYQSHYGDWKQEKL